MKTKKICWERPKLIDLRGVQPVAQGRCLSGSNVQGRCRFGSSHNVQDCSFGMGYGGGGQDCHFGFGA